MTAPVRPGFRTHLARLLSKILHPFIVTTLLVPLVVLLTERDLTPALRWTGAFVGLVITPPLVLLFVRVRSQQVESYDVLIRRQRSLFYGVGISGLILLLILMAVGDGPAVLRASLLAALATNLLAGTINHFVTKISVHAGAMAGCTAVLVAIAPWPVWAVSGLLTLALGWARVQLGRHTVGQVLLGWGVAGGCVAVVFWLLLY